MNLIGDIQGNYRTLLALLKQMPDDDPVSVGDMICLLYTSDAADE